MVWEKRGRALFLSDEAGRQHLCDWLFLETLRDMRHRNASPLGAENRYRLLGLAPLLRKMVADGKNTLVDAVRKPKGRPIPVYRSAPYATPPIPDGARLLGLGVGGGGYSGFGPPSAMNLGEFLKMRAGHIAGHDLTVLEVIQHYSYVEGGVHFGVPTNPASRLLQMTIADPLPGYPDLVSGLAQISTVVVDACGDLESAVAADYERRRTNPRPDEIEPPNERLGIPGSPTA